MRSLRAAADDAQHDAASERSAAAIKLEEWDAATIACEHALATEPTHDKALYRLAQAHEGRGEVSVALALDFIPAAPPTGAVDRGIALLKVGRVVRGWQGG